jgi:very-short-patch-repair endonuclease
MKIYYNPKLKQLARNLRNNSTLSEVLFWKEVRGKNILGYQFLRQKPIGNFIVDFYCPKLKLAIEIDGDSHAFREVARRDKIKDAYLNNLGIHLIRYEDHKIKKDIQSTISHLIDWIENWVRNR